MGIGNKLFIIMNRNDQLLVLLQQLELTYDEAVLYLALTESPNTHLGLATMTNINRTKVYRLINQLEKRGLVTRRTDDRGTFLVSSGPRALEAGIIMQEENIRRQHKALEKLIPELIKLEGENKPPFAIHTYEGIEGFKQMQWHELEAITEVLVFGNITVEQLVGSHYWSEKFRALAAEHGTVTREIYNRPYESPNFTSNQGFMEKFSARFVPPGDLPIKTPMVIYNDTVATYQFSEKKRVGAEIINASHAETMRSIFEHYWQLGAEINYLSRK